MSYKRSIAKHFGHQLGGKHAYIYELSASGRECGRESRVDLNVRLNLTD